MQWERTLEQVAPKMARSTIVKKDMRETFGEERAERMLAQMKAGSFEGPDGTSAHDFLYDRIHSHGKVVWERMFGGEWPVSILSYGGVYLIQSPDHDDIGYFELKQDAIDRARMNWLGL